MNPKLHRPFPLPQDGVATAGGTMHLVFHRRRCGKNYESSDSLSRGKLARRKSLTRELFADFGAAGNGAVQFGPGTGLFAYRYRLQPHIYHFFPNRINRTVQSHSLFICNRLQQRQPQSDRPNKVENFEPIACEGTANQPLINCTAVSDGCCYTAVCRRRSLVEHSRCRWYSSSMFVRLRVIYFRHGTLQLSKT